MGSEAQIKIKLWKKASADPQQEPKHILDFFSCKKKNGWLILLYYTPSFNTITVSTELHF